MSVRLDIFPVQLFAKMDVVRLMASAQHLTHAGLLLHPATSHACLYVPLYILHVVASMAGRETSALNVYLRMDVVSRPYSDSHTFSSDITLTSNTLLHSLQIL